MQITDSSGEALAPTSHVARVETTPTIPQAVPMSGPAELTPVAHAAIENASDAIKAGEPPAQSLLDKIPPTAGTPQADMKLGIAVPTPDVSPLDQVQGVPTSPAQSPDTQKTSEVVQVGQGENPSAETAQQQEVDEPPKTVEEAMAKDTAIKTALNEALARRQTAWDRLAAEPTNGGARVAVYLADQEVAYMDQIRSRELYEMFSKLPQNPSVLPTGDAATRLVAEIPSSMNPTNPNNFKDHPQIANAASHLSADEIVQLIVDATRKLKPDSFPRLPTTPDEINQYVAGGNELYEDLNYKQLLQILLKTVLAFLISSIAKRFGLSENPQEAQGASETTTAATPPSAEPATPQAPQAASPSKTT